MVYILRRLAWVIPTLLLVSVAVFGLLRLVPGDPAQVMLGDVSDPQRLALVRDKMGLNQGVIVQYLVWLKMVLRGDLGHSLANGEPVLPLLLYRFQVTASIVIAAVTLASLIAIPLGTVAAWKQNSRFDFTIIGLSTLFLSIPSFWLGLMLLGFFGLKLGWLPVVGYVSLAADPLNAIRYIVLPIATLTIIEAGTLARMARSATIDVLRLDYVAHARSKGLTEGSVLVRHVFPNAFAPTLTLLGIVLGNLLGGIAVIETVFTLPGLGRLMVDGIVNRDYPVVQGSMLLVATVYVLVNLVVDLLYPVFDPRVWVD